MSTPRLSFDTSAVNALADCVECTSLLAGIRAGYFTRLTFPSVSEPLATSDAGRRNRLIDVLNALRLNGECAEAHHWIITQLVQNHAKNSGINWHRLPIRFAECEIGISRREFSDSESQDERKSAFETEAQFIKAFTDARPRFEKIFEEGTQRPTSADELLARLSGTGEAFWIWAARVYERAAGVYPTEAAVRAFTKECPPFLTFMLGLIHGQFEWSIREQPIKKEKRIGKTDLFCATFLPYCDLYITNDDEQRRCLTEIAATAKVPVEILSLADFNDRLMPLAHLSRGA